MNAGRAVIITLIILLILYLMSCKGQPSFTDKEVADIIYPTPVEAAPEAVAYVTIFYDTATHKYSMVTDFNTKIFISDCEVLIFLNMHRESICSDYEIQQFQKRMEQFETDTTKREKQIY